MAGGQSSRQPNPMKLKLAGGQRRSAIAHGQSSQQADTKNLTNGQACRLDVIKTFTDNFYDVRNPSSFSTYEKLYRTAKTQSGVEPSNVKSWFEQQDAYTLHKHVQKRFPRNPYTVNNIMDLWEADLVDVQSLAKHNDGHRYLLTVIDVFTKYLHIVPLKSKPRNLSLKRLKRF